MISDCLKERLFGRGVGVLDGLVVYRELIEVWNRKVNLVSRRAGREEIERHILDCLVAGVTYLENEFENRSIGAFYDIGTGAGFPGIVWSMIFADSNFILVEPNEKRVGFLQEVKRELGLGNVEVWNLRLEGVEFQEGAVLISRATGLFGEFFELYGRGSVKYMALLVSEGQELEKASDNSYLYKLCGRERRALACWG